MYRLTGPARLMSPRANAGRSAGPPAFELTALARNAAASGENHCIDPRRQRQLLGPGHTVEATAVLVMVPSSRRCTGTSSVRLDHARRLAGPDRADDIVRTVHSTVTRSSLTG